MFNINTSTLEFEVQQNQVSVRYGFLMTFVVLFLLYNPAAFTLQLYL